MMSRRPASFILPAALLLAFLWTCVAHSAPADAPSWRIRFLDAAVLSGPQALLGEIAAPVGDMPADVWRELSQRELWPAPSEEGRPMNMTRPRLQEAVMRFIPELGPYCLFPPSMTVQRGGALIGKEDVQRLVSNELAPYLATLPGEAALSDFRLPQHVFLSHSGQNLELEAPRKVNAGRLSLRLIVRELDGSAKQKLTGSVFVDCWASVPHSASTMNKEELLEHDRVTFKRINLASLRGEPWDGRGGPWRLTRPLTVDQIIYKSDLAHIPTVRKGARVTLLYEGKTVRLSVPAEAMSDGAAGETIAVRNAQTQREVFGMVRDGATIIVNSMSF